MICKIRYFEEFCLFFDDVFSSLRKLISLTDLNLSGNNIQTLPQIALSSMENLQTLSLHSNQLRAIPDLRRLNLLKVN
jgi:Leucine-rich repeat (LRR) protein